MVVRRVSGNTTHMTFSCILYTSSMPDACNT